jgi:hypothetical protein
MVSGNVPASMKTGFFKFYYTTLFGKNLTGSERTGGGI